MHTTANEQFTEHEISQQQHNANNKIMRISTKAPDIDAVLKFTVNTCLVPFLLLSQNSFGYTKSCLSLHTAHKQTYTEHNFDSGETGAGILRKRERTLEKVIDCEPATERANFYRNAIENICVHVRCVLCIIR